MNITLTIMIILISSGGLGNQLFNYALYNAFEEMGRDVYIDKSRLSGEYGDGDFLPDKIFGLNIQYANEMEYDLPCIPQNDKLRAIKKGFRTMHKLFVGERYVYQKDLLFGAFSKATLKDIDDVAVCCTLFMSEKPFKQHEEDIRNELKFKEFNDEINVQWAEKIVNTNSVSMHVRRGDYLAFKPCEGVCSKEYYERAIKYTTQKEYNSKLFVFSNDIEWCQAELNLPKDTQFVNNNVGYDDYKDMQLMSLCKHNIIANSTFSWWGAWLNSNPNKIVVAPKRFYNGPRIRYYDSEQDIFPKEWVRL